MAKHDPIKLLGNPLAADRYARNGRIADPVGYRLAAHRLNTIAALRRRMFMSWGYAYDPVDGGEPAEASGTSTHLFTVFRTLPDHASIAAHFALAPSTSGLAAAPRARLTCVPVAGGAPVSGGWVTHNSILDTASGFPGYGFDDMVWGTSRVELAADTAYYATLELDDYCTLFSAMVYEEALGSVDDTASTGCNPARFVEFGDIQDSDVAGVVEAATALWQKSGAYLLGFTQRAEDAVVVDSTTYTNVLDGSTVVGTATPGFVLDTQYHRTRMRSTIPVEVGVVATRVSGVGSLNLALVDPDGNALVEIGGIADGASIAAGTIEASSGPTKYDLWAACEAGESWRLHCVGLWEYDG